MKGAANLVLIHAVAELLLANGCADLARDMFRKPITRTRTTKRVSIRIQCGDQRITLASQEEVKAALLLLTKEEVP